MLWGHPLDAQRAIRYNIASRDDLMTRTIQPPLLAWAWAWAVGDPRARAADRRAPRRGCARTATLEDDGLLWLIQPDESGMDASPKFDHVWGRLAQGRPLFPLLIARNRRAGLRRAADRAAGVPWSARC